MKKERADQSDIRHFYHQMPFLGNPAYILKPVSRFLKKVHFRKAQNKSSVAVSIVFSDDGFTVIRFTVSVIIFCQGPAVIIS